MGYLNVDKEKENISTDSERNDMTEDEGDGMGTKGGPDTMDKDKDDSEKALLDKEENDKQNEQDGKEDDDKNETKGLYVKTPLDDIYDEVLSEEEKEEKEKEEKEKKIQEQFEKTISLQ